MKENMIMRHFSQEEFKVRWRQSINQLSKLQQDSKLSLFDTKQKKVSKLKLKMKNRLAQIDDQFNPLKQQKIQFKQEKRLRNTKVSSTNYDTNVLTSQGLATNFNLEQSIIYLNPESSDNKFHSKKVFTCHQIKQNVMQELTDYNKSRYQLQMKQNSSKYNSSVKSIFYSIFNNPKKIIPQFCYNCDQIIQTNSLQNPKNVKIQLHLCKNPINSLQNVQLALQRIQNQVQFQNNKIFRVFLHNTLQPQIEIQELVNNLRVLKQAIQLRYQPEQAILRMRLMNLIGKKIGILLQQNQLEERLKQMSESIKNQNG